MITVNHYVVLGAVLFCIGLYGVITSRSALRFIVCVELMLNAVNVNLVAFSLFNAEQPLAGLSFVVLAIVVAAAEVGLALALVVALNRSGDISAIDTFTNLRD
ncbi:MAG TPA: NADH-quinone oxidoreductase subunit NuoK [Coriobacteriia bacterium]|nr:NADH-quinone oxidoreductase subunit NuoK [Coriobacteriia bacterium]